MVNIFCITIYFLCVFQSDEVEAADETGEFMADTQTVSALSAALTPPLPPLCVSIRSQTCRVGQK